MSHDRRYDARDFVGPRSVKAAQYDRLREGGIPAERAREIASESVDKTLRQIDRGLGLSHARPSTAPQAPSRPNPLRVRFPWEPDTAGITLDPKR